MSHPFEVNEKIELEAAPDQVWAAIATGPGVDSWFMGRTEIEPREGGTSRLTLLGGTSEATVTAYEPGRRLAYRSEPDPEHGTFMAFEYLVEGRGGGSTVLRLVHSGVLGDDWEEEYDALRTGDGMYLRKLAVYLRHFAPRSSSWNLFLPGAPVRDHDRVRSAFRAAFGLAEAARPGAPARLSVPGLPPADGVLEFADDRGFLGVRTADSLYMLVHGFKDAVVVEQHSFAGPGTLDEKQTELAWQQWLGGLAS